MEVLGDSVDAAAGLDVGIVVSVLTAKAFFVLVGVVPTLEPDHNGLVFEPDHGLVLAP